MATIINGVPKTEMIDSATAHFAVDNGGDGVCTGYGGSVDRIATTFACPAFASAVRADNESVVEVEEAAAAVATAAVLLGRSLTTSFAFFFALEDFVVVFGMRSTFEDPTPSLSLPSVAFLNLFALLRWSIFKATDGGISKGS